MTSSSGKRGCNQTELVTALALGALPANEEPAIRAHLAVCVACREEFDSMQEVVGLLPSWPLDSIRPDPSLWNRLAARIQGSPERPGMTGPAFSASSEPDWEEVAPGIRCKILSVDDVRHRLCMLVRLSPGTDYPPHTHAGVEELHLLEGELWINDRKLFAGDYNRAEPGTADRRVWSETGCTCVLTTSLQDRLG
jgi:anti-sigma factor ChrR (cupin superfamily)